MLTTKKVVAGMISGIVTTILILTFLLIFNTFQQDSSFQNPTSQAILEDGKETVNQIRFWMKLKEDLETIFLILGIIVVLISSGYFIYKR